MKIQAVDVSQLASASMIVFEALRRAIVEGHLVVGEPLRQDDIARRFKTSRLPVREALTRLEELGLVKTQRHKGAVVAGLSVDEAVEIFDFRTLVESEVMRRAVPRMTPAVLATARRHCEAFIRSDDPLKWSDLNRSFHGTLLDASGLTFHLEILAKAMDRIDRYLRVQLVLSGGMALANEEHQQILQACENGEAEVVAELTRRHIQGARASFLDHLPRLMDSYDLGKD